MNITAASEKTKLDLFHLAKLYFPLLSEENNFSIEAIHQQNGDAAEAEIFLSCGENAARTRETASLAAHFSPARAASCALGKAFHKAAEVQGAALPPYGTLTGVKPVKVALFYLQNGVKKEDVASLLQREYFVFPEKAALLTELAALEQSLSFEKEDAMLYLSIPFCPSRCSYCSFISSSAPKHLQLLPSYLEQMTEELRLTGALFREKTKKLRAVYMGGGTPGILSAQQLDLLLTAVKAHFDLQYCTELSVEIGRPDTITEEKLLILKKHGVDRISINPQTTSDKVLSAIGRRHSAEDFFAAMRLAQKIGFDTINCDLICGLSGDSLEGFLRSVEEVLSFSPENITLHSLCRKNAAENKTAEPMPRQAEAMEKAHKLCIKNGFEPYYLYRQKNTTANLENAGFAQKGHLCLYNLAMMEDLCDVFAVGAGAVTKLIPPDGGRIRRFSSYKYPYEYLADPEKIRRNLQEMRAFLEGGKPFRKIPFRGV